jgi:hypothetical protein
VATNTTNYGLIKPDGSELVSVATLNTNYDTLDSAMSALSVNLTNEVIARQSWGQGHLIANDPHGDRSVAATALAAHTTATNPHNVTALLIGALTMTQADIRYLRSVNNLLPDAAGNVDVSGNAFVPLVTGSWYTPIGGSLSGSALAESVEYAFPFVAGASTTITRIAIAVLNAGSAHSVVRLGVRRDSEGLPGTLLVDAGTVDTTSVGSKSTTISAPVVGGNRYWLTATTQGAATNPAVLQISSGANSTTIGWGDPYNSLTKSGVGYAASTPVTGFLPTNVTGGWIATTSVARISVSAQ